MGIKKSRSISTAVQLQKVEFAHVTSKHILPFGFTEQGWLSKAKNIELKWCIC